MTPTPEPYDIPDDARVTSGWDDAIERDGEMLVLCGNDVSLLSVIATEAALAARRGITVSDLAERLVEEFGHPEGRDPGSLVRQIVAALVSRGVMTLDRGAVRDAVPPTREEALRPVLAVSGAGDGLHGA
ncbi:MAG: hypothetical protein ACLGHM_00220 [Actinomycetes bacterium]|jgi:hypothetical protein